MRNTAILLGFFGTSKIENKNNLFQKGLQDGIWIKAGVTERGDFDDREGGGGGEGAEIIADGLADGWINKR